MGFEGLGQSMPIAIVGMSCKFPGDATSTEKFWELLEKKRNAWTTNAGSRFNFAAHYHPQRDQSGAFNPTGAHFLQEDASLFDATFFSISATEAKAMDPQQRQTLESTYEAIESAGITTSSLAGSNTAVFVNTYNRDWFSIVLRDPEAIPKYQALGTGDALISNRISYFFDLKGPSMTLDTGSSGSMIALHQACQSLRFGESSQAIVSAVNLILDPELLIGMSNLGFLSDNGRCLTFDARGNGYGRGEGIASLVIKPLDAAMRDGNPIRAIIRNTYANQDGRTPGITMPSVGAQVDMIRGAYRSAGLKMAATAYCECHGTGTPAGDPVEAKAIAATLARAHSANNPLIVGSVKTNIGHLESCASMAGLIKVTMMLEKGIIVPNYDFQVPLIQRYFWIGHMKIPDTVIPWPSNSPYRRASVNAFGYGGTNCHAILDAAESYFIQLNQNSIPRPPNFAESQNHPRWQEDDVTPTDGTCPTRTIKRIFILSARTDKSLQKMVENLASYILDCSVPEVAVFGSLAYTLCLRRSHHPRRMAVTASSLSELADALNAFVPGTRTSSVNASEDLCFCFTGQGAQWPKMGKDLFETFPVFRSSLLRDEACLIRLGASWCLTDELLRDEGNCLAWAEYSQPICTAIQIALVDLLSSWGVRPAAVIGHSSGEIAAAYACGSLSAESAMKVAFFRGIWAKRSKDSNIFRGAMLATNISESEASRQIASIPSHLGRVTVACVNSPSSITISGDEDAIKHIQGNLESSSHFVRRLLVDTAYHSHHMEAVAESYLESLGEINPGSAKVPFFSSVHGQLTSGHSLHAQYWVDNLLFKVNFPEAIKAMCKHQLDNRSNLGGPFIHTIVEIGPHSALSSPIKQTLRALNLDTQVGYQPSLVRGENGAKSLLNLAGELFVHHYPVNLEGIFQSYEEASKVVALSDLPSYAWDHSTPYWTESRLSSDYRLRERPRHQLLGVPSMDWNPLEPSWRHIIRANELPWVRGHVVGGQIIYPAAGYIAAVLQACHERHITPSNKDVKPISQFSLRDIHISNALVIPDDPEGIEMVTRLRPYTASTQETSSNWQEFIIYSYSRDGIWSENCRGFVVVEFESHSSLENIAEFKHDLGRAPKFLNFYERLRNLGYQFSEPFLNIQSIKALPHKALASVRVPNTAEYMNQGYERPQILHPATLDSVFQAPLAALAAAQFLVNAMVPVHCDRMTIAGNISHNPGEELSVYTTTTPEGPTKCQVQTSVTNPGGVVQISIEGLHYTTVNGLDSMDEREPKRQLCHQIHWIEDVDRLHASALKRLAIFDLSPELPSVQFAQIRAACYGLMEQALRSLRDDNVLARASEHHKHLYEWMKRAVSSQDVDNLHKNNPNLRGCVESIGAVGEMIYRIGSNLNGIILGEVEPLELMTAGKLLDEFYQENSIQRCYSAMAHYVRLLCLKDPTMRILEVGAGTGGATQAVLEALDGKFTQYDFTDISAGFFENAQEKFRKWGTSVMYQKLNIENDPIDQGFQEGSYDLVVAANVIHATKSIQDTMRNVRSLLKPGGRLLLLEITRPMVYISMIFGTLPGWWLGRSDGRHDSPCVDVPEWQSALQQSGFSGVDVHIPDYDDLKFVQYGVIISRNMTTHSEPQDNGYEVIINPDVPAVVDQLCQTLCNGAGNGARKITLAQCEPEGKVCIVLEELVRPLLFNCGEAEFNKIKEIFAKAAGIIWLSAKDPDKALITGLARTVRSEQSGLKFVTVVVDMDRMSPTRTAKVIKEIYQDMSNGIISDEDSEFAEQDGTLLIPRLIADERTTRYMTGTAAEPAQEREFTRAEHPLGLEIAVPGQLDTLQWQELESTDLSPAADEIFVEVEAFGLNFRDLMIALGQFGDSSAMTGECSGIIRAVGRDARRVFNVGDRVCGWSAAGFCSYARMKTGGAIRIGDLTSFEEAASIPVAYTTAYYALIHLANLQSGESVLIQSAAGAVGQAAIMLAQYVGAKIFVTVGNDQKKDFLRREYGIHDDHMFSSRSTAFVADILKVTEGRGVDVVLNSVAGEIGRASHHCLALFGRFVELGLRDILQNARMHMRFMERNVSFYSVDMTKVLKSNPSLFTQLLTSVFRLWQSGYLKSVKPIAQFDINEIDSAFRTLQTGKHIGKVVVRANPGIRVKVASRPIANTKFRENASYLIAGGLGGLGRAIIQWMGSLGACNFVVLSRYGLHGPDLESWAADLRQMGFNLSVYPCDITDKAALTQALEQAKRDMPPICGVIQAAMMLKDSLVENMSHADFCAAVGPKAMGSLNLHHSFLNQSLDFFILLSSAAGVVGNTGQANYAAGCTVQDALAQHRTALGFRAHSIDLGMVQTAGYVAENPKAVQFLQEQGYLPLELDQVFRIINKAIQEPATTPSLAQTVVGLHHDETMNNGNVPRHLLDPKFKWLLTARRSNSNAVAEDLDFKKALRAAKSRPEAMAIITDALVSRLERLLALKPGDISQTQSIAELGADSLVAVELRSWINKEMDVNVQTLEILQPITISNFATTLANRSKSVTIDHERQ